MFEEGGWRILTPRHAPQPTLEGHLTFALKYEGLDLAVLKRLFLTTSPAGVKALVRAKPTGSYARRIWFLYEWLTGRRLDLPDRTADLLFRFLQQKDGRLSGRAREREFSALTGAEAEQIEGIFHDVWLRPA